ncbi:class I SAM-dependent methyltransferase [Acidobacteriota bacterium]
MNKESYNQFYQNEYRTLYGDLTSDIDASFLNSQKKGDVLFDLLTKQIDIASIETVCDIGCHMGAMLIPFLNLGKQVFGADFNEDFLSYGRKRTGIENLFFGGIEQLVQQGVRADLIILNHVFEHFVNIEEELNKIKEIMNPDSYVFISVPGTFWWLKNICGGDLMGLLQSAHTYQFSLNSLTYVMECCGFKEKWGTEEINSIYRYRGDVRQKTDIVSGEADKVINYLQVLEKKHRAKASVLKILDTLRVKDILKKILKKKTK